MVTGSQKRKFRVVIVVAILFPTFVGFVFFVDSPYQAAGVPFGKVAVVETCDKGDVFLYYFIKSSVKEIHCVVHF